MKNNTSYYLEMCIPLNNKVFVVSIFGNYEVNKNVLVSNIHIFTASIAV